MVLQQYVDKWFPDDPADVPRISEKALKKMLLDVRGGGVVNLLGGFDAFCVGGSGCYSCRDSSSNTSEE